jgi:AcrR family transcriptional regulator
VPKETTKQETREAILDAAERLLTRYGFGKMTMSDLAEEAGIGVGTTYLHFPGKAEVALAVVTRANMRVVEEQRKIAASSDPVESRLREVLTQRVLIRFERLRQHKHSLAELRAALERQKGLSEQGRLWREQEAQIVAALLIEGQHDGVLEKGDAALTADAMLWAIEAFLPKNLRQQDLEPPHLVPERVQRIVDLLLRAVERRKPEA